MKNFKKYCHIENSYQTEFIDKAKEVNGDKALYVCQEKVDGSNFSFIAGRNESGIVEVSCGKRSSDIEPSENFFGWQVLLARYQEKIIKLFEILEKLYDCSEGVNIFGEIFGGYYKDMKSEEEAILGRISYTPRHEFYGFDIFIPSIGYLSPVESVDLFEKADIFHAENLFIGTLDECLKLNPVFPSTIAKRLGFDEVEGNMAEGYVIKPVSPSYFGNGDRIIIKHKNPRFAEVTKRKEPKDVILSDELTSLCTKVEDYVNENRLVNVRSHLGEISLPKDFGILMKEFSADVIQEFIEENTENKKVYESLEKSEQKRLSCHITKLCASCIKDKYMS